MEWIKANKSSSLFNPGLITLLKSSLEVRIHIFPCMDLHIRNPLDHDPLTSEFHRTEFLYRKVNKFTWWKDLQSSPLRDLKSHLMVKNCHISGWFCNFKHSIPTIYSFCKNQASFRHFHWTKRLINWAVIVIKWRRNGFTNMYRLVLETVARKGVIQIFMLFWRIQLYRRLQSLGWCLCHLAPFEWIERP